MKSVEKKARAKNFEKKLGPFLLAKLKTRENILHNSWAVLHNIVIRFFAEIAASKTLAMGKYFPYSLDIIHLQKVKI